MSSFDDLALPQFIGLEEITEPTILRWFGLLQSVLPNIVPFTETIDVASVAANTTAEQTFTVTGLPYPAVVIVNKPSHDVGLGIVNARVSAADTLELTFMNATGSAIDPGSEDYNIIAIAL